MFVFALIVVVASVLAHKSRHWGQPQVSIEPVTPVTEAEVRSVFIPCSDGLSRLFAIVEWQDNCVVLQRRHKTLIVARHKIERLLSN